MLIKKQTPNDGLSTIPSPFSWNPLDTWGSLGVKFPNLQNFFSELEPVCWGSQETEDSVVIELAVPGFLREELDINVHGRGFSVKGKSAKYSRSYMVDRTLGCKILPGETKAELANGILSLTFKKEAAKKLDTSVKVEVT